MIEEIEQLYQTLQNIPRIYYALSQYAPNKIQVCKFPNLGYLVVMHPDKFPEFREKMQGCILIDFRTSNPLSIRQSLTDD